jgi:hypothetical protein
MPTTTNRLHPVPVLLAAGALLLTGCADDAPAPGEDVTVEDIAEAGVDEGDDVGDDSALAERVVTVEGQVRAVLDPGAFLVGDPGVLEPSVLVMSPSTDFSELGVDVTDLLVEQETLVEVTGTLRELSLGQFQEDYDIPYDEDVFEEYAGEAVIVAERLVLVEGSTG